MVQANLDAILGESRAWARPLVITRAGCSGYTRGAIMSDLPIKAEPTPSIRYPEFIISVPGGAQVEDLITASNSARELAIRAHHIVFWLEWLVRPLVSLGNTLTAESLLADLTEDVDRRIFECNQLVTPLRLELVQPVNCYAEGTFHAPCAHDAALSYAREVRNRLDLPARLASKEHIGAVLGEVLPGSALRGNWDDIVRVYRETMPDRFQGLPSIHALLNRLLVETTAAINARIRETEKEPLPEKQLAILRALDGRALTLKALAEAVGGSDPSRLHRDHIKPLMALGRIKPDRKIGGYYRPDVPPALA